MKTKILAALACIGGYLLYIFGFCKLWNSWWNE